MTRVADPWQELFGEDPLLGFSPPERMTSALYAFEDKEGLVRSNVARDVAHHAAPGAPSYREGRSFGPGPPDALSPEGLDLALNALNAYVPPGKDGREVVECRLNAVSATAFELHEDFAREVLAGGLEGPGELSYRALMDWVEKSRPGTERRLLNTGA